VLADGKTEVVSAEAGEGVEAGREVVVVCIEIGGVGAGKAVQWVCVEVGGEAGGGEAAVLVACVEAGGGEEAGMVMVAGREAVIWGSLEGATGWHARVGVVGG
jgi:hypothetical protein